LNSKQKAEESRLEYVSGVLEEQLLRLASKFYYQESPETLKSNTLRFLSYKCTQVNTDVQLRPQIVKLTQKVAQDHDFIDCISNNGALVSMPIFPDSVLTGHLVKNAVWTVPSHQYSTKKEIDVSQIDVIRVWPCYDEDNQLTYNTISFEDKDGKTLMWKGNKKAITKKLEPACYPLLSDDMWIGHSMMLNEEDKIMFWMPLIVKKDRVPEQTGWNEMKEFTQRWI